MQSDESEAALRNPAPDFTDLAKMLCGQRDYYAACDVIEAMTKATQDAETFRAALVEIAGGTMRPAHFVAQQALDAAEGQP